MGVRADFLTVADSAVALLADPAVEARWTEPSALPDFNVGGLAVHLAMQIVHVLRAEPAEGAPISLAESYARASWLGQDLSHEMNVGIRRRCESAAEEGVQMLVKRTTRELDEVRSVVATAPDDLVVRLPWSDDNLTFDDLLTTRLMELVVHSDDLAVSVGVPTPAIPDEAASTVVNLLCGIALRRHGAVAMIRALSRSERAPATIAAL